MVIIKVGDKKIERVLKEYRQKLDRTRVHRELRDRKEYTKKSVKRREQMKLARYRNRKNEGLEL
jgi:small subunit ribosomal protein S21